MKSSVSELGVPKYVWMAAGIAVLLIAGSIWWASSLEGTVRSSEEAEKPLIPEITVPRADRTAVQPFEPPATAQPQLRRPQTAKVTVTPDLSESSRSQPVPEKAAAAKGQDGPRRKEVGSPIKDMFPVGPVGRYDAGRPGAERAAERAPAGPYPIFGFDGRRWAPTGKFAASEQLELQPVDLVLGDRRVYSLANVASPYNVLFLESGTYSGMFAIYRGNAG